MDKGTDTMNKIQTNPSRWDAKVKKNTLHLHYWTWTWVFSIGLLGIGPQLIWNFNILGTVVAGLINIGVGIGMIMANIRYVKEQDEMHQKIFLEAAALTLGVTIVFGGSYQLWGVISFEPQVWHLMAVMGLTFTAGMAIITRKYQ